jgi:hypothetical protein
VRARSPASFSEQETLCSLQFASRVRSVEKGKATKHDGVRCVRSRVPIAVNRLCDSADNAAVTTELARARAELEKERAAAKQSSAQARSRRVT